MKLDRRHFLRASGVSLALPWLESLAPAPAPGAAQPLPRRGPLAPAPARGATPTPPRRRMVCVSPPLSLHPPAFFPEKAGKDYALTHSLAPLKALRDDFTVMSGLAHPDV